MREPVACPPSSTSVWITLLGLASLLITLPFLHLTNLSKVHQTVIALVAAMAPIILLEMLVLKVHRRESTGLIWDRPSAVDWARILVKVYGFAATIICIGVCYWAFKEYSGSFYQPFWELIREYGPWAALAGVPYFIFIDGRMREPRDGYWHFAMALLGRYDEVSKPILVEHVRGWIVKAFFLPLMFVYLVDDIVALPRLFNAIAGFDVAKIFEFSLTLIYTVDVLFAVAGYILMFRLIDAHLRWAEPTMLGWTVAVICYQPFWSIFYAKYLNYEFNGMIWGQWLASVPALKAVWGAVILFLFGIYSWATVQFGCRFSNLTHRGIVTNGPYRFTKHPAYITKNITWWMVSVPFVTNNGLLPALKACSLLLMINVIYFLRAKTEERHLMRDPVYAAYAAYIDRHGIFRWVSRLCPPLGYRLPPLSVASDRAGAAGGASPIPAEPR